MPCDNIMASKYKYSLRDYQVVKSADINIDGITVVTGINGCGKTTLSKWLYYIVNGINDFDKWVLNEYIGRINDLNITYIMVDGEINGKVVKNGGKAFLHTIGMSKYKVKEGTIVEDIPNAKQWIDNRHDQLMQDILTFLQVSHTTAERNRILNRLDVTPSDGDSIDDIMAKLREKHQETVGKIENDAMQKLDKRRAGDFAQFMMGNNLEYRCPRNISFSEDEVKIIDGMGEEDSRIRQLFSLSRAIYVNTPMAAAVNVEKPVWWKRLRELMLYEDPRVQLSEGSKLIMVNIEHLLKGNVKYKQDNITPRDEKLVFVNNDGREFKFDQLATGFLVFSYVYRLLANGILNSTSMLIIDEPEAHLHPQWIAEFARDLVLLHKLVGVKVVVATHSPYMAEAIRQIANGEGVLDDTLFYIATSTNEVSPKYNYCNLVHETGEIFDSFNTVYDRIDLYEGDRI